MYVVIDKEILVAFRCHRRCFSPFFEDFVVSLCIVAVNEAAVPVVVDVAVCLDRWLSMSLSLSLSRPLSFVVVVTAVYDHQKFTQRHG